MLIEPKFCYVVAVGCILGQWLSIALFAGLAWFDVGDYFVYGFMGAGISFAILGAGLQITKGLKIIEAQKGRKE